MDALSHVCLIFFQSASLETKSVANIVIQSQLGDKNKNDVKTRNAGSDILSEYVTGPACSWLMLYWLIRIWSENDAGMFS